MGQEKNPRFEHITIGGVSADDLPQPEEEEVTTIGAVDAAVFDTVAFDAESEENAGAGDGHGAESEALPRERSNEKKAVKQPLRSDDEQDFGEAMPLPQKIVLICCAIGLVIVIAFLLWFWLTQR